MDPCIICSRPATEELDCYYCYGMGSFNKGTKAPKPCAVCGGSGKLPYCKQDAALKKSELIRNELKRSR